MARGKKRVKIYENILLPFDDWYITSTLTLDDDGAFRYHESWSCYAGNTDAEAEGVWRLTDQGGMTFETIRVDGALLLGFSAERGLYARERGDGLDFGNDFVMRARPAENGG